MSEAPLVPGTVAEHTICLLTKIGQVAFRIADDGLGDLGLRVRHYSVLQALADNGSMSQLALGTYLRIDPATMVTSLDDLERAGYAVRERDARDRRRYVVRTTDAGREILAGANRRLISLDSDVLADLSAADRQALHRMMNELASGPTLPPMFDAVRDQAGAGKMQGAGSRVGPSEDS
ncbi:MarR family winged helix-turn-helix transcriptional regulator [Streptomyces sp. NBC_00829]|uniref:MarR family winged helix-turn-helix transcriptional regulator n=1 Tax=Streptomyces sp. NBC_00829 TaxID=2903679 RepID=UPI00386B47BC|nr:MarR family winged helix-turn-helix transcriptional regulator [Streptomyces sp. NBC_00829]